MVASDSNYCSLVLINRGVIVSESGRDATIEVTGYGLAEEYQCVLDSGQEFDCECHLVTLSESIPGFFNRNIFVHKQGYACIFYY